MVLSQFVLYRVIINQAIITQEIAQRPQKLVVISRFAIQLRLFCKS